MGPDTNGPDGIFDRPVFIVAAPRSGSTFLFETLSQCADFFTIGDESHVIIESIRSLVPGAEGVDSNRLTEIQADPATAGQLRLNFRNNLHDRDGTTFSASGKARIRMLEKTPKNALRIPFLKRVFPDALFIYLHRDARENISSIIDAWNSGGWITYSNLPGWEGDWSLLLPPGWQDMKGKSPGEIAAFQWRVANQTILADLARLESSRWTVLRYRDLVANPIKEVRKLCRFAGTGMDRRFQDYLKKELPLSRYTLAPPAKDKWKKNEQELEKVLPPLGGVIKEIERRIEEKQEAMKAAGSAVNTDIGRNAPCPCGSGKKYKRCHGA